MLLALLLTSLIRERLGYRAWRAVHWLAYACWPIALWHGLGTGTDSRLTWLLGLDAVCVAAVAGAAWWRISLREPRPGMVRVLLAIGAVPLITGVFVLVGPLRPGWARRAGTPVALLGTAAAHQVAGPSGVLPGDSRFRGHVVIRARGPEKDETTITVAGRTSGSPREYLRITLQGRPDGSGIALSRGSVGIGPDSSASTYLGPVVLLDGQRLSAALRSATGSSVQAQITLVIHGSTATGRLSLRAGGPA
jgi:hypothetical protein